MEGGSEGAPRKPQLKDRPSQQRRKYELHKDHVIRQKKLGMNY